MSLDPKKGKDIIKVVEAPVVNEDPNSQEALLARSAKAIQVQSEADSKYDTVLERFSDFMDVDTPILDSIHIEISKVSIPLLSVSVVLGLFGLSCIFQTLLYKNGKMYK
jgi:hypothetical protein